MQTQAGDVGRDVDPLNVIVHVPKTAGSALNASLQSLKLAGHAHCEAVIGDAPRLSKTVARSHWVSGHVSFDKWQEKIAQVSDRPLRFYAATRDPIKQVMSHYNWLIEIYHREPAFYNGHPENIRDISRHIREADNTDPDAIVTVLATYPRLFLNVQSRYIMGDTGSDIAQALEGYARIAHEETVQTMLIEIAGSDARLVRENVSPYHFDRSVFETERMRRFLKEHNAIDEALYAAIRERWPS